MEGETNGVAGQKGVPEAELLPGVSPALPTLPERGSLLTDVESGNTIRKALKNNQIQSTVQNTGMESISSNGTAQGTNTSRQRATVEVSIATYRVSKTLERPLDPRLSIGKY